MRRHAPRALQPLHGAIGKFARYVTMTTALLWLFPGQYTP